ncbi:MAG: DUF4296 domain-containing protein [Ferruginibacter sp.]
MRYFVLLFLSILVFSCKGKNDAPGGILKPDKMQEVFWDYIRADIYASEYLKRDSGKNAVIENLKLQDKVFKLHHTSREVFYKSYNWYANHKELMKTMLDSMVAKKQREKTKASPLLKSL